MPKRNKSRKPRNMVWFTARRGSYIPVSWQGWFLYVPFILYIILVFLVVFSNGQSLVNQIVTLVPYLVGGLVIITWVAKQRSK